MSLLEKFPSARLCSSGWSSTTWTSTSQKIQDFASSTGGIYYFLMQIPEGIVRIMVHLTPAPIQGIAVEPDGSQWHSMELNWRNVLTWLKSELEKTQSWFLPATSKWNHFTRISQCMRYSKAVMSLEITACFSISRHFSRLSGTGLSPSWVQCFSPCCVRQSCRGAVINVTTFSLRQRLPFSP